MGQSREINKCLCTAELYREYGRFLELPDWVIYGANFEKDCQVCEQVDGWGRIARNHVHTSLLRAVQTISRKMKCAICPEEKTLLVNPVTDNCPIQLETPIWYFGKRVEAQQQNEMIHWGFRDACNIPYACASLNPIGQLVMTDVPDEWEGDFSHVEFSYPNYFDTNQCLPRPRFDYQCCSGEKNDLHRCAEQYECPERCQLIDYVIADDPEPGYCMTFTNNCDDFSFEIGQRVMLWRDDNTFVFAWVTGDNQFSTTVIYDLSDFVAISIVYFVATWEAYQLISPDYNFGLVKSDKSCDDEPEFLNEIEVTFYEIQPGIEIAEACSCSTCKICTCSTCNNTEEVCETHGEVTEQTIYDYELDECTGELCLTTNHSSCSCPEPHRIKITYGVKPDIDEDIQLAIILRAFLWSNAYIKCGCQDYNAQIEHWLGLEPGVNIETFATTKHYPYGRTRAGVELMRLLEAWQEQKQAEGKLRGSAGLLTMRQVPKLRPGDNPRRFFNPREH